MSKTYTLARDGLRPVRFHGTLLAESLGARQRSQDQKRYYDIAIYQTEDGRYVGHWHYRTQWQGEEDHQRVEVWSTLAAVVTALEAFDPTAWVMGYKGILARHPHYNTPDDQSGYFARQQMLEHSIRERYAGQVMAICAELGEAYEIVEEL